MNSNSPTRINSFTRSLPFILPGLVAVGLACYATAWGPWTFSDGVGYMISAKNLVNGPGLGLVTFSGEFEPLVSHPPAYSLCIALLFRLGLPVVEAARWIDVVAFGLFASVVPALYSKTTGSQRAGLAAGVLFLSTPAIALHFLGAISEPGFLTAGFTGLLATAVYVKSRRIRWFWLAVGLLAIAVLFRYPAIAFVFASCVFVLIAHQGSRGERMIRALALGAAALVPAGLFVAYAMTSKAAPLPRALRPSIEVGASFVSFAKAIGKLAWEWKPIPPTDVLSLFLPSTFVQPYRWAVVGCVIGASGFLVIGGGRRWRGEAISSTNINRTIVHQLLGVFAFAYLGFVFLAYLITYPTPDLDQRTMLPLLVTLTFVVIEAVRWTIQAGERRTSRVAAAVLLVAVLAGLAPSSVDIYSGLHRTGLGYTAAAWRRSPTLSAVSQLPSNTELLSNAPEAILLYTERYPYSVASLQSTGDCPPALQRLTERGAIIVSFDPTTLDGAREWDADRLIPVCDLTVRSSQQDGTIYQR